MNVNEFKHTFLPCHQRMYAVAWRLTGNQQAAEDLVQDTLLKLWSKRNNLNIPANAEAFAVITLRNLFYDGQRKKKLKENDEEPSEHMLRTDKDPSDLLARRQEVDLVHQFIETLPPQQRHIITLHDIDNLNYEEIEAETGLSAVSIRVALSRARKAIREKLKGIRTQ